MKAIYACKLYKASPRKSKIRAAIESPLNAELVTQLSEYLDEEYQSPQYLEGKPSPDNASDTSSDSTDAEGNSESSSSTSGGSSSGFSGGGSSSTDMNLDDVVLDADGNPMEDFDDSDSGEASDDFSADSSLEEDFGSDIGDSSDASMDDIEESTEINGSSTEVVDEVADTDQLVDVDSLPLSREEQLLSDNVESIKLMLNADEETEGVERISLKNSELWIYYNDFINLNNIMSPVIEFLARGNFTYLEFNRLARSANAIVFQVSTANKR